MKKKPILILSILTLISCDVASVDVDDENYVFDGRGGIKCKVDGKLIKPKASLNGTGLAADIDFVPFPLNDEDIMSISFLSGGESPDFISEAVRIKIINIRAESVQVGDVYELQSEIDSSFGKYGINPATDYDFSTDDQNVGELKIVFHDFENRILGGTFEYDAVDTNGNLVEIREGEFDMKYLIN
ncbi:MAG: hypothetical protein AAF688_15545 [Bacteroidota bacterium]